MVTLSGVKYSFLFSFNSYINGDAAFRRTKAMRLWPLKENITQKIQNFRRLYCQYWSMDERVRFYAQTFRGTVFVTEDGAIVYSLPEGRGRDVPDGASQQVNAGVQRGRDAEERGRKVE